MANAGPVQPHPVLEHHYHDEAARQDYVRSLFDDAAPYYDWINRMMSLDSGLSYRRIALLNAGLKPGMHVLDIATGTGLVARAAARIVGPAGQVVGIDPSRGMLMEGLKILPIPVTQGRGEALPFVGGRFDFVGLGYGLRHVADISLLSRECFRVLKPGGQLLILEFARPRSRVGRWLGQVYLQKIIPAATRWSTRNRSAELVMRYCWDTVEQCTPSEIVLDALSGAGFALGRRNTVLGILSEYTAQKSKSTPVAPASPGVRAVRSPEPGP